MCPGLWEIVIAFLATANLILLLKTCSDLRLHRALLFNLRSDQLANAHLIRRIFIINCADDTIAAFCKGTDKFSFTEARVQAQIIAYLQDEMLSRQRSGLFRTRRVSNLPKLAGEWFRPDLVVDEAVGVVGRGHHDRGAVDHGGPAAGGPGVVPYLGDLEPLGASYFQPLQNRTRRTPFPDRNNNEFVSNYFELDPLPVLHPRPVRPGSRQHDGDGGDVIDLRPPDEDDVEVSYFMNGLGSSVASATASFSTAPGQE